jgi:hypothetical protein
MGQSRLDKYKGFAVLNGVARVKGTQIPNVVAIELIPIQLD